MTGNIPPIRTNATSMCEITLNTINTILIQRLIVKRNINNTFQVGIRS